MSDTHGTGPSFAMDRRKFLKMGVAGLAGASLLSTVNFGRVLAQPDATLEAEFAEAAARYRVPQELLKAMAYVNTGWEMPPPEASPYREGDLHGMGTYGIMQLVQNPSSDTLGEASRLTGISEEALKTDRRSNILGGAALLAESQGRSSKPSTLGGWFGAVDGRGGEGREYRTVAGVGGGEIYSQDVAAALTSGARKVTKRGEEVALRALSLGSRVNEAGEVIR
jgi:hypothetical protein